MTDTSLTDAELTALGEWANYGDYCAEEHRPVLLRLIAAYRMQAQTIAFQKDEIDHLIENLHDSQALASRPEEPR